MTITEKPEMTVEEAIRLTQTLSRGRTRWAGQEPFRDEILVQEIFRLRLRMHQLETELAEILQEAASANL